MLLLAWQPQSLLLGKGPRHGVKEGPSWNQWIARVPAIALLATSLRGCIREGWLSWCLAQAQVQNLTYSQAVRVR